MSKRGDSFGAATKGRKERKTKKREKERERACERTR